MISHIVNIRKSVQIIAVLILLLSSLSILSAEETTTPQSQPANQGDLDFNFGITLGVDFYEDELGNSIAYQKVGLSPDIAIGPFGIGLDVVFHYRFVAGDFDFLAEGDWVPLDDEQDDWTAWLELYLSKFKYIRYGHKGEDLFVKFGSIDDGTLGNGFIMGNYANTLFLPEKRIFGLSLDVDGGLFGFPLVGLETHVGNLGAFDVFGGRFFTRPLVFFDIPVISDLQIGGELVVDRLPYKYSDSPPEDEAMALFFGADARLPILNNDAISFALFGDLSSYKGESIGGMLGFSGSLFRILLYGAQARFIGDGFIPVYFDPSYDVSRAAKYELIESGTSPGYMGWFATLGAALLNNAIVLAISLDGPFSEVDPTDPSNYLNYPHLRGTFTVAEGLVPGVPGLSISAMYDKTMFRDFESLVSPEGALSMIRLNYKVESVLITFFYNLKFATDDWTKPEITSGLETSIQLF